MSKRALDAANEAATLSKQLKLVMFARLDFASGVQRFHTEIGPKTAVHPIYGSELYLGIGDFGGISGDVKEGTSNAPEPLRLTLTGLKASLVNLAIVDDYFRRDAELMIGFENELGNLIADPEILYSGYMDKVDIVLQEGTAQMTMTLEHRGTNLLRASDHRFTDEDKQAETPGDLAGEYIWEMTDIKLRWGSSYVWPTGGSSGRGGGGGQPPTRQY